MGRPRGVALGPSGERTSKLPHPRVHDLHALPPRSGPSSSPRRLDAPQNARVSAPLGGWRASCRAAARRGTHSRGRPPFRPGRSIQRLCTLLQPRNRGSVESSSAWIARLSQRSACPMRSASARRSVASSPSFTCWRRSTNGPGRARDRTRPMRSVGKSPGAKPETTSSASSDVRRTCPDGASTSGWSRAALPSASARWRVSSVRISPCSEATAKAGSRHGASAAPRSRCSRWREGRCSSCGPPRRRRTSCAREGSSSRSTAPSGPRASCPRRRASRGPMAPSWCWCTWSRTLNPTPCCSRPRTSRWPATWPTASSHAPQPTWITSATS